MVKPSLNGKKSTRLGKNGRNRKLSWVDLLVRALLLLLLLVGVVYLRYNTHSPSPSLDDGLHLRNTRPTVSDLKPAKNVVKTVEQPPPAPEKKNDAANPWEGWMPSTTTTDEGCSFRKCFQADHSCPSTCRDSPSDMGIIPSPPNNWIPDVTMLRRMFLKGADANGNPFPPPLPSELCEDMGVQGNRNDDNKQALDAISISPSRMDKHDDDGPKVLCMMYTMAADHGGRVRAVRETWGGGCDGFLAFSTESDPRIPAISIPHDGEESYGNMWQKVRSIWRFVGEHYLSEFDFFMLGGDDLMVLPGSLRDYLGTVGSAEEDHFIGRRFKGYGKDNYFNSGGAGYVLSRGTLRKFVANLENPLCVPKKMTSMEDVMIADCLRKALNIRFTDTRDEMGRERFHPFAPGSHYKLKHVKKGTRDWYEDYNQEWGIQWGADCCSPSSVSFHYMKKPAMVRHIHKLLYHCDRSR